MREGQRQYLCCSTGYNCDNNEMTDSLAFHKDVQEYAESAYFNGLKVVLTDVFLAVHYQ